MDMKKPVIIVLLVIIIALLVASASAMPFFLNKQDTNLTFKSKSTFTEGDSFKIKLTDDNGTALANQTINVTITDKDNNSDNHSVVTNSKGVAKLKLDKNPGKYVIKCNYSGNDSYNACNASKKIKIKEEVVEAEPVSYSGDPGAFYSQQAMRTIYTGEVEVGPDGHTWKHLGYNEWVKID